MNESTALLCRLMEHYDAVQHLHLAAKIIAGLSILLLIQTSRAAYHRARHAGAQLVNKRLKRQIESHCEEITWHRSNGKRLEARLFKEPLPVQDEENEPA